jgi:predicted RNase H-like HicB family nuclease
MAEQYICTACFCREDNGTYTVQFPDLEGCMTIGSTFEDAFAKAIDACSGWLLVARNNDVPIPMPNYQSVFFNKNKPDLFYNLLFIDLDNFNRKVNKRSIKKSISMPAWLCELAEQKKVNYSKVLQDALKDMLNVD